MNSTLFTLMVARDAQAEGRHEIADALLAEVADHQRTRHTNSHFMEKPARWWDQEQRAYWLRAFRSANEPRWTTSISITGTQSYTLAAPQFVGERRTIYVQNGDVATPVGTLGGHRYDALIFDDFVPWARRDALTHAMTAAVMGESTSLISQPPKEDD